MFTCLDCGSEDLSLLWLGHDDAKVKCKCGSEFYIMRSKSSVRKDISAHWQHFPSFFKLMMDEMDRHQSESGDSWLTEDTVELKAPAAALRHIPMSNHLVNLLDKAFHSYMDHGGPEKLEDIANFCAVIRLRGLLKRGRLGTKSEVQKELRG
jgi:transcription elongation factor Elf1